MRYLAVSLVALLLHCGSSSVPAAVETPADRASYVGRVGQTNVKVALVVERGTAALFFCGVAETQKTHTVWFRGTTKAASFDGAAKNGATAHVDFNEGGADGTLTLMDGTKVSFSVPPAPKGSVVDLYEAKDESGVAGVVVAGERDVQGVFIAAGSNNPTFQITPLSPAWKPGDDRGVGVQYAVGKETRLLRVFPVKSAPSL
jgi:hypothetical protein